MTLGQPVTPCTGRGATASLEREEGHAATVGLAGTLRHAVLSGTRGTPQPPSPRHPTGQDGTENGVSPKSLTVLFTELNSRG